MHSAHEMRTTICTSRYNTIIRMILDADKRGRRCCADQRLNQPLACAEPARYCLSVFNHVKTLRYIHTV